MTNRKEPRSFARRVLACVCSLALGAALVPAVASTALAADETVLTVKIQDAATGAELTPKGSTYTAAQLEELAKVNTKALSYLSGMKGGRVDTTASYVTIDQLVGSFPKWAAGSSLVVTATDGLSVEKTYEEMTGDAYFYPNYTTADKSDAGKETVPPVLALTSANTAIGEGTAADAATTNATAEPKDAKRQFLYGLTDAKADLPGGKVFPSDVATVVVKYPHKEFTVYAKNAKTEEVAELKEYTKEELTNLAKVNTTAMNFLLQTKSLQVMSTNNYIKLKTLLASYGQWNSKSSITLAAPDGFSTTMDYNTVNDPQKFWPAFTTTEKSITGAVENEPVIALSYVSGVVGSDGETAQEVATVNATKFAQATEELRVFRGAVTVDSIPAGNTAVSGVESLTISYDPDSIVPDTPETTKPAANTLKVSPTSKTIKFAKVKKKAQKVTIKATKAKGAVSYKITKKASKKISVTKKGVVTLKKGAKKGKYVVSVTAAGNSSYKSKTVKVTITVK